MVFSLFFRAIATLGELFLSSVTYTHYAVGSMDIEHLFVRFFCDVRDCLFSCRLCCLTKTDKCFIIIIGSVGQDSIRLLSLSQKVWNDDGSDVFFSVFLSILVLDCCCWFFSVFGVIVVIKSARTDTRFYLLRTNWIKNKLFGDAATT